MEWRAWHLSSSVAVNTFIFEVDCPFEVVALATKLKGVTLQKRKPTVFILELNSQSRL